MNSHLFTTAPFADHFMNVPIRYGVMLDLGILEGIAAQWDVGDVDDHVVSAVLIQEQKAPNLQYICLVQQGFGHNPVERHIP